MDIPGKLRELADEIEHGTVVAHSDHPLEVTTLYVVIPEADEWPKCTPIETLTVATAWFVNNRSERG